MQPIYRFLVITTTDDIFIHYTVYGEVSGKFEKLGYSYTNFFEPAFNGKDILGGEINDQLAKFPDYDMHKLDFQFING